MIVGDDREVKIVRKIYLKFDDGVPRMQNEILADYMLNQFEWKPAIFAWGKNEFTMRRLAPASRLDRIGPNLSPAESNRVAAQVLEIILDLFSVGLCHNDIKAENVFYSNNQCYLIDYEGVSAVPVGQRFIDSTDVSFFRRQESLPVNLRKSWLADDYKSNICVVLRTDLDSALYYLEERLAQQQASGVAPNPKTKLHIVAESRAALSGAP